MVDLELVLPDLPPGFFPMEKVAPFASRLTLFQGMNQGTPIVTFLKSIFRINLTLSIRRQVAGPAGTGDKRQLLDMGENHESNLKRNLF